MCTKWLLIITISSSLLLGQIIINEVDADQNGTDSQEFVELYDGGAGNTALDGLVVVLYNGSNDQSYDAIDLDGKTTDTNGYFVIGSANVEDVDMIEFTTNGIQNGADAVALYQANAADFPNGTSVTTNNLIDALVYDTNDNDDSGLLVLLNADQPQVNEAGMGNSIAHSNQRSPNGSGGARNTDTYIQATPTPGADNPEPPTITPYTIAEIQGESDSSLHVGELVETSGIVTAVGSYFYWLQNGTGPWNGIYLYAGDNHSAVLGDSATVVGTVQESHDLTQIIPTTYTVVSQGNDLPRAAEITTADVNMEMYEGVLVSVSSATCTNTDLGNGEWEIDDGTGVCAVDDKMYAFSPTEGVPYDVTGLVHYSYAEYKIEPRDENDVSVHSRPGDPVADAGPDQTVDYAMTVTLDGSNSYDSDGVIIGYTWEQTGGETVILSDYEPEDGITTFTAPTAFTILTFKLTVMDNNANQAFDEVKVTVGSFSIHDIQYTTDVGSGSDDCYPSPYVNEVVTVSGMVTAVKPGLYPNFYIQDPNATGWGGVYVYDLTVNPTVGDEITLTAEVDDHYGLTELKNVSSYTLGTSGNTISAIAISTGDLGLSCNASGEAFEGMLVTISNVTVDSTNAYNSWYVDDGSGTAKVDDYFFDGSWITPDAGDTYSLITGAVHYYYGEYVIYPRNASDIVALTIEEPAIADKFSLLSSYPNPFNSSTAITYRIEESGPVELGVYDILGNKVVELVNDGKLAGTTYSIVWNGKNSGGVDVPSGIYFARLAAGKTTLTKKITLLK